MLACLSIPQRSLQGRAGKISTRAAEIGQPFALHSVAQLQIVVALGY